MVPSLPPNEALRLQALQRLRVLDSPREAGFDRFTKLAAAICEVPIAAISLVDAERQWFKSIVGLDTCETNREIAFCAHAILQDQVTVVPDATLDARFKDNPLVTGAPRLRYYCGSPLITSDGYRIGTLCVIDTEPRLLSQAQISMLTDVAGIVVEQLEQRLLKERVAAAEQERRNAERIYEAIVASIHEVVFQLSKDALWSFVNPAWTQISGYSAEETLGRHWLEYIHAEDRELASSILRGDCHGRDDCHTFRWVHKDGSAIYMEATVRASSAAGHGSGYTGTLYDLTEHRNAEERLRQATVQAEKASRAKSDFLSRMSHEIRTPMNSLLGFSELLSETDLNEQQQSYVQIFRASAHRLLTLVNDILDLSQVEAGEMKIQATEFNPAALASETVELLQGSVLRKNISILLTLGEGVDGTFEGDAARIRQILINLLGNAVKFTAQGDIYVRVAQRADEETLLEFEVEDTGPGIPQERLPFIFDAFVQADAFITRRHGGSGLGLTICRELVSLMQGKITVQSELGKGSTFRFSIPVCRSPVSKACKPQNGAAPIQLKPAGNVETHEQRARILIADDFEHNVSLCRAYLGPDYEVDVVGDGKAALELVKKKQFDVVLMDVQMPVMDGITATRLIREWERTTDSARVAIIALTAHALEEERKLTAAAGCDAHLSKPITKRELLKAISDNLSALPAQAAPTQLLSR